MIQIVLIKAILHNKSVYQRNGCAIMTRDFSELARLWIDSDGAHAEMTLYPKGKHGGVTEVAVTRWSAKTARANRP